MATTHKLAWIECELAPAKLMKTNFHPKPASELDGASLARASHGQWPVTHSMGWLEGVLLALAHAPTLH